jgi:hypothetical protein
MRSQLGSIRATAAAIAAAAEAAIRAKAQIHSPSRISKALGNFWGGGYVLGIKDNIRDAWRAAKELVSIPMAATPDMSLSYAGTLSDDYSYNKRMEYTIYVPLEIDGREFARAEASYMQEEINKRESRDDRKRGKR